MILFFYYFHMKVAGGHFPRRRGIPSPQPLMTAMREGDYPQAQPHPGVSRGCSSISPDQSSMLKLTRDWSVPAGLAPRPI